MPRTKTEVVETDETTREGINVKSHTESVVTAETAGAHAAKRTPRARFVGDPSDDGYGPNTINMKGVLFEKNIWRDVPDPFLFAKLEGHSHFETEGGVDDKGVAERKARTAAIVALDRRAARRAQRQRDLNPNAPPDRGQVIEANSGGKLDEAEV